MKVIFLDIEGVLTNYASAERRYEVFQNYNIIISEIDESTVRRLAKIVCATGAKVVLTSSLRGDWARGIENIQLDSSKQLQRLFDKYNIEVVGVTPYIPKSNEDASSWREHEINYYLNKHKEIEGFCIIDDEIHFLHSLDEYVVKVDSDYGLQDEHVDQAIKILETKSKLYRRKEKRAIF